MEVQQKKEMINGIKQQNVKTNNRKNEKGQVNVIDNVKIAIK